MCERREGGDKESVCGQRVLMKLYTPGGTL